MLNNNLIFIWQDETIKKYHFFLTFCQLMENTEKLLTLDGVE